MRFLFSLFRSAWVESYSICTSRAARELAEGALDLLG